MRRSYSSLIFVNRGMELDTLPNRERFLRVMRYQAVDRFPHYEMGIWGQTLDRWQREGMPWVETVGLARLIQHQRP